jgi:hypothetical protein
MPQAPFYAMSRGWLNHSIFGTRRQEPFCRAAAWCWLIEEAGYEQRRARVNGKIVELLRGQLSHSIRFMAEAWGWHRNRVSRFLGELSRESMIGTDGGTGQLIITICNYDTYQAPIKKTGTERGTHTGQERDRSGTDLNKETNTPYDSSLRSESRPQGGKTAKQEFEDFWSECPRKVGKDAAARKYLTARKQASADTLLGGMRRYASAVSGTDKQYIVHPAAWLHQGRWKDEHGPDPPAANGHDAGPQAPPVIKPEYLDWMRQMDEQENPH